MARFHSEQRRRGSPSRFPRGSPAPKGSPAPARDPVLRVDRSDPDLTVTVFRAAPRPVDPANNLVPSFCRSFGPEEEEDDESDDGLPVLGAASFAFCSMEAEPEARDAALEYALIAPSTTVGRIPVVAFIHGGDFLARGDAAKAAVPTKLVDAARRGDCAVAVLTHRIAEWPAPYDDLRSQLDGLRASAEHYGVDATALGLFGVGSGGFLALVLASRGAGEGLPVRGAVSIGGQTSLPDLGCDRGEVFGSRYFWEPSQADAPESRLMGFDVSDPANVYRLGDASPANYLRSAAPTFLAHGQNDGVVPVAQALRHFDDLLLAGVAAELCVVPGAGRDVSVDLDAMPVAEALSFLRAHLGADF